MQDEKLRFNALFDAWAATYDAVVAGADEEYADVFDGYDRILERVAEEVEGPPGALVVEIGVGTGNLTKKLLARGYGVIGVEPSQAMRAEARRKAIGADIREGSFLHLPLDDERVWAFVSTYAFHHLTDAEKEEAVRLMAARLQPEGKIVFADTAFVDDAARRAAVEDARRRGFVRLVRDLEHEYYPLVSDLEGMLARAGFRASFERMNRYVWLWKAVRG
ncbi:MAG: SAM-dependent methyltransferase YrrT [Hydrogenibacillus schlegelii]|uniref:Uncharacterized methyltransferase HSCHL_2098 n=1 Tax=Hydrogenibacillus schlegelii TaxID=1484 RepID=A0A2T5GBB1_HYDSH|nr:class I SAM-dependent methyltransferase [Hydrogenibacillus schlegelii]PTQ53470.1 MAG: SAM-dependent methyltransferase YrrT [Hydrogenibacillus schlegelii]